MQTKVIGACVGCLLVGLVLGRLLPGSGGESRGTSIGQTNTGGPEQKASRAVGRSLSKPTRIRRSPENQQFLDRDSGLNDPERDGKLVVVPAALIGKLSQAAGARSLGQDLFTQDGEVEQYLQISDREKKELQSAWRATQKEMRMYESNAAQTEDMEDGSVKITVPDMSSAMKGFGDGFHASVVEALGENRADAFVEMKQLNRILAPVQGDQAYTVKVEAAGDGRWRYHMSSQGPEGRRVWIGDSIPQEIRHLTDVAKIKPSMNPEPEDDDEE